MHVMLQSITQSCLRLLMHVAHSLYSFEMYGTPKAKFGEANCACSTFSFSHCANATVLLQQKQNGGSYWHPNCPYSRRRWTSRCMSSGKSTDLKYMTHVDRFARNIFTKKLLHDPRNGTWTGVDRELSRNEAEGRRGDPFQDKRDQGGDRMLCEGVSR
ncbi:hypothetical protein EI94DRAFT_1321421 [Lactarius quietus]|nr:hypothetical protein EI94DRAFT_1321421 [Lactarius quietus]